MSTIKEYVVIISKAQAAGGCMNVIYNQFTHISINYSNIL